ncbi:hypothetical protein [Oceanobacillus iheyensis HTE831]|uniref:PD-(D/E)XK motif protein n=1 Tax=Oceanobacillus iheyensis (strain DSM 14371 / CIP 107618 / JCM 11309 / KCTC 3954 / HTE831) TaxID=221109 RepID=Q8EL96_OCEIH|nr:PD-(D/E)XK motif protein [Oceanobacillus iheyensis]BAC15291.1 hypothetical protein [Oceanobacillus iheyensis HTE831]
MNYVKLLREQYELSNYNAGPYFRIESIDNSSFLLKAKDEYGVAIEVDKEVKLNERFNQLRLYTTEGEMDGKETNLLNLSTTSLDYVDQFFMVAADYIDLNKRQLLMKEPLEWWDNWRELLGNAIVEKPVYSVLAELLVLNYLQDRINPNNLNWVGYKGSTYDISKEDLGIEVKSSINKFDNSITISNQYQLHSGLTHEIYVLKFEPSQNQIGITIDDIVLELVKNGYSERKVEKGLTELRLSKNSASRRKKFILLGCKKYNIKDVVPLNVEQAMSNFLDFDLVKKISVEIDLSNIKNEIIKITDKC